ncbi:hypothetical protein ACFYY2_30210 [Streptomyces sp. NPDC001822]|uniref:hypothetical protein n=1 Tax=Streptomyces sp. NPDC001822 TaxID=3364614 RepID=UPI0036749B67
MLGTRAKRFGISVLLFGTSLTGVAAGSVSASASPAGIQNLYQYQDFSTKSACDSEAKKKNLEHYGNYYGNGDEYFYCAYEPKGIYALWWRRYV